MHLFLDIVVKCNSHSCVDHQHIWVVRTGRHVVTVVIIVRVISDFDELRQVPIGVWLSDVMGPIQCRVSVLCCRLFLVAFGTAESTLVLVEVFSFVACCVNLPDAIFMSTGRPHAGNHSMIIHLRAHLLPLGYLLGLTPTSCILVLDWAWHCRWIHNWHISFTGFLLHNLWIHSAINPVCLRRRLACMAVLTPLGCLSPTLRAFAKKLVLSSLARLLNQLVSIFFARLKFSGDPALAKDRSCGTTMLRSCARSLHCWVEFSPQRLSLVDLEAVLLTLIPTTILQSVDALDWVVVLLIDLI